MDLRPALVDAAAAHRKKGHPTAILVRHAERDAITDLSRHEEALLTENGHARAAIAGRLLASSLAGVVEEVIEASRPADDVTLIHSPVPRCKETALGLHKGLLEAGKRARIVGERAELGASYLKDPIGLARSYLKHGKGFVRAWFDGEIDLSFIDSCDVVAQRQLQALQQSLREHPFVVAVTHDWNIAALKEHALGLRFEDTGWPQFLDGVVVALDGNRVIVDAATDGAAPAPPTDMR